MEKEALTIDSSRNYAHHNDGPQQREWYQRLKRQIVPELTFNQTLYEDVLAQHVSPKSVWMDAGCGHRVLPNWRAESELELVKRARVALGCDVDVAAIRVHRSLKNRVISDLGHLPFKSGTVTLITCNMVAEHLDYPEPVFREFARVLAPGGDIIVHTPFRWSYFAVVSALTPQFIKSKIGRLLDDRPVHDYYPVRYRCNTPRRLRTLFRRVGLQEVRASLFASDAILQFLANSSVGRLILRMELYLLRLSLNRRWRFLRLSICGVYRKVTADRGT